MLHIACLVLRAGTNLMALPFLIAPSHIAEHGNYTHRGDIMGSKATGLFSMPLVWTPPFSVITTELFEKYTKSRPTHVAELLNNEERSSLESAVQQITPSSESFVIVRSSATK